MKKLIIILTISLSIISCSKDNNTTPLQATNNDLIGTWKISQINSENTKMSGTYTTAVGSVPISTDIIISGKDYNMTITFADNPKKISNSGSFIMIVKINLPLVGEKSFEQTISEVPATEGDWNIKNNILTTTNNGTSSSINIVSYNQSEIIFSYPLSTGLTDGLNNPSFKNIKTEGNIIIKATKQ